MIGLAPAFTAGFAIGFPDSEKGIRLGMAAAQRMLKTGFIANHEDGSPEYPVNISMTALQPEKHVSVVNVPSNRISSGDSFSIFDALTGDPSEVARRIVRIGPDRALTRCSVTRFGDLRSVDRIEQESLASMVDTMQERLEAGNVTPTCLGIIGPVGSGKKFVAKSLSDQIGEQWPVRKLTYNARVLRLEDLTNACHTIRDFTAENTLTVVTFENFEWLFQPDNTLLDEFTALMRHGTFKDEGRERGVGRCLLLFLVNQSISDNSIVPTPKTPVGFEFPQSQPERHDAALLDNLHGMIKLKGPDQGDKDEDKTFAVRRAFMIRRLIERHHPQIIVDGTIQIDEAVLHALLFVPRYKHGLRSLDKIISTSRLSKRKKYDIAALPPEEQIQLHVDGKAFMQYLRSPKLTPALRERLAEGLFERYKKQREIMAKTDQQRRELLSDRSMVDWDELPGELKESTRSQADDIPRKLRTVNCYMIEGKRSDPFVHVPAFSESELDILAEMEHERFNAERLQRQWRMGARNSKQRTTPFLVPWRDLSQEWRDVDRVMVECAPKVLEQAGWYIYREEAAD